ncbi:ankyrin [Apiospora kogelbergensis]|uniref:Ankyrin n=1 Tax=Apiospora kogelbergensis TaxID=1337665 RepID=A0AAW0QV05_9PEZI
MDPADAPDANRPAQAVGELPPEAITFAGRMYDAARTGHVDVLKEALRLGLPANMTNEKGDTLLMLAAYHGHAELVELLLHHGADPNRINDRGQSPLAGAVFKKEDRVVEVLLQGSADPDLGSPSAMQCVTMFNQEGVWKEKFEKASGKGKGETEKPALP